MTDIRSDGTSATGLAFEVVSLRRGANLTTTGLATLAGVSEADMSRIETGDVVPEATMRDVCLALDLPPWRHLAGAPHGLVRPVDAVDGTHRRDQAVLTSAVGPEWLLMSDVVAQDRSRGWEPERRPRLRRIGGRASVAVELAQVMVILTVWPSFLCASLGALCVLNDWITHNPKLPGSYGMAGCGLLGLSVAYVARRAWKGSRVGALVDDAMTAMSWRDMTRRGYAFSADGLGVLDVGPRGLTRTDHPLRVMSRVAILTEDADHVTVEVATHSGEIRCPWLPRSRDVIDA